ncbi:MAG: DNA polymerase III subunit alpha [Bacteroidota bacterium]
MYLTTHSWFSLRYGTMSPKVLVDTAAAYGIGRLALADVNNTSSALEFVTRCRERGIAPTLGISFWHDGELQFVGLARNDRGWAQLNRLLTAYSHGGKATAPVPRGLTDVYLIYPRLHKPIERFREHEFLGIRPEHVNRLFGKHVLSFPDRLVAWAPATLHGAEDYNVHRILRAVAQNALLDNLGTKGVAKSTEVLLPPDELRRRYATHPFLLDNATRLLAATRIDLAPSDSHNLRVFTAQADSDYQLLEKLAREGIRRRYGPDHGEARRRLERELIVVRRQGFCAYFLIAWDLIRYANGAGYAYVGRGSGANSLIAYALGITDVDPLLLGLPFERFLNEFRASPPDFDIDFSHDERDDVLEYIFSRYGTDNAALLATYATFKGRSIIREVGKVYGLPKAEIDRIVADPHAPGLHPLAEQVLAVVPRLSGVPSHLGIHAGGVVISHRPLTDFTALELMPKGVAITHFDMYHGEDWGLHKYDVLSQRGLGHIKTAVRLVKENRGRAIDVHATERIMADPRVREQLRSARCMGCFYIESPAMRQLLSKLRCDNYLQLVAASSIIRPGVASSGMMAEYIRRHHDPASFDYLHPLFEQELGETYGVMVYQEDVMKIANAFAGLPLDECDVLRRIMSGKKDRDDSFARLEERFFTGCRERGHPEALAREVWRQISSFAGYSFCKAHSASYAVESFQSLYLKTYFPLEFMVAVINNFGGFYGTEYYVHEARMCGAEVEAPCINHSVYLTCIQGKRIYLGFVHLKGLRRELAERIVRNREAHGPFASLEDFAERVDVVPDQFDILIRIGAFRFTGVAKHELMWRKLGALRPTAVADQLFAPPAVEFTLPELTVGSLDQAFDEMELLGFPLCSPFSLLAEADAERGVLARELKDYVGREVTMLGYYVCRKPTRTKQGKLMGFGTWLDREGQFFDPVLFP